MVRPPTFVRFKRPWDNHACRVHLLMPPSALAASSTEYNVSIEPPNFYLPEQANYPLTMFLVRRTILSIAMSHRRRSDKIGKDKRQFAGEKVSQPLVELLNAGDRALGRRTATSRRRMEKLFGTVSAMLSLTKETTSHLLTPRADNQYESLIRSLNRQLRRYRETRLPFFVLSDDKEWWFDYVVQIPGVPVEEQRAVAAFIQLGESGLLERVRRCSHCQKWIFARFPHQSCCSAYCRERLFRSSEQWKAKRRKKAKEYYWLHRNKNVK